MLSYPAIAAALHNQHRQDLTAPVQRLPAQPRRQTGPVQAIRRAAAAAAAVAALMMALARATTTPPASADVVLGTVMVPLTRWPAGRQVGVTARQR